MSQAGGAGLHTPALISFISFGFEACGLVICTLKSIPAHFGIQDWVNSKPPAIKH
jgi:hypothetical protein